MLPVLLQQNARKQEVIRQAEEAKKKRTEEEEKANDSVKQQYDRETQARLEKVRASICSLSVLVFTRTSPVVLMVCFVNPKDVRSHSPPVPTHQKRLGHQVPPRPPSVESQRSATAFSVSHS